ncbi:BLUF domain-containing protein [Henriciella litoralis]|uniref:BLUF domain-containing protein n=1 Tax=Henriciella litoralis TaxID=568102 RepID=UPI0009FDB9E9|nr:BLUF domain-containing protein [Henriciella litoralis]
MYRIAYVSTAHGDISSNSLQKILESAIENNRAAKVTGIMLFNGSNFLQLLEGPQENVEAMMAKICKDKRHRNIVVIMREKSVTREFEDNPMLLQTVKSSTSTPPEGIRVTDDVSLYLPSSLSPHFRNLLENFDTIKA